MRKSLNLGALLLLGLALSACAHGTRNEQTVSPNANVAVQVRNDAFWDATIYLVRESSERIRLGIANGMATTTLPVSRGILNNLAQVRFLVTWIGRPGRDVSESIMAQPGDTIELQIRE